MAARLECETRYYGSHILLSDAVVHCLSSDVMGECRLIDNVDLVGGQPMKVYTMDLDDSILDIEEPNDLPKTKSAKFRVRWDRTRRKNERWHDDFNLHSLFETDTAIVLMRKKYTEEFFCRFQMAYLNYEAGNWPIAKVMLEGTRSLLNLEDGASCALLRLLQKYGNISPRDWQGFREFGDIATQPLTTLISASIPHCETPGHIPNTSFNKASFSMSFMCLEDDEPCEFGGQDPSRAGSKPSGPEESPQASSQRCVPFPDTSPRASPKISPLDEPPLMVSDL